MGCKASDARLVAVALLACYAATVLGDCRLAADLPVDARGRVWVITDRRNGVEDIGGERLWFARAERAMRAEKPEPKSYVDEVQWAKELADGLSSEPQNIVIFLHGSGQTFEDAACIGTEVSARYGVTVVSLDWAMSGSTRSYQKALRRIQESAARFSPALPAIAADIRHALPAGRHIKVLAHSMGARMLQLLTEPFCSSVQGLPLNAVVLSSADIVASDHVPFLDRLRSTGARPIVLINREDNILAALSSRGGVGRVARRIVAGVEKADIAPRLGYGEALGTLSKDTLYIDVTETGVGARHEYYVVSSYSEKPPPKTVENLLSEVFVSKTAPTAESLHLVSVGGVWRITE